MIRIFDTTLRDGEQAPGCSMVLSEKLEVARQLEKLGIDVVEAGFAAASPGDFEAVKQIALTLKDTAVTSLCRASAKDIDRAWEAIAAGASPMLHIVLATSPIHMKNKLRMTEEEVLSRIADSVAYAKGYVNEVEFSAEDAFRSERAFLIRAVETAVAAGATVVNLPDTVGYAVPEEAAALFRQVKEEARGADRVLLSAHFHDDLGLAVANSLTAVAAGAGQVECTLNGIGERAGNAALEEIVMALVTRQPYFDAFTGVNTRHLYRSSRLIQTITGIQMPANKAIVGANAFAHEAGIHQHGMLADPATYEIMTPESIGVSRGKLVLGKHSGRHAFEEHLEYLGYYLPPERMDKAFEKFKQLADRKKYILDRDLEAIIGVSDKELSPGSYQLINFVINSGNTISATAKIRLSQDGVQNEEVSLGEGPVDASFKAINKLVGRDITLDDYGLHSVTEGEDALGEAVVKLSLDGKQATGRGLSTDVIEASIRAYLNGVNKLFGVS